MKPLTALVILAVLLSTVLILKEQGIIFAPLKKEDISTKFTVLELSSLAHLDRNEIIKAFVSKGFISNGGTYSYEKNDTVRERIILIDSANIIKYIVTSKPAFFALKEIIDKDAQEELDVRLAAYQMQYHRQLLINGTVFIPQPYSVEYDGYILDLLSTQELTKLTNPNTVLNKKDCVIIVKRDTVYLPQKQISKPARKYPIDAYIAVNQAVAVAASSPISNILKKGTKITVTSEDAVLGRSYCDFVDEAGNLRGGYVYTRDITFKGQKPRELELY